MSRQLWEEEDELPSGTVFWGGKRGMCIQLTKFEKEEREHYHITFSIKSIPKLIRRLRKAEKWEVKE